MKRTYETCGKEFTSRKAADRFARNIANASGLRVPVYETTGFEEPAMSHTPGPWSAEWDDNGQWYIEPLGVTGTKLRGDSGNCVESANAHLIAAAPDLLEIVQMYRAAHCGKHRTETGDICVKCTQADEAIRKATGA